MKIDQTHLTPAEVAARSEGQRGGAAVVRSDGSKKLAIEPHSANAGSPTNHHSQPIILDNKEVHLRFNKDEETGVEVIQVVDADSGELVRQIPPEELLNIAKALRDIKGLIVSKES